MSTAASEQQLWRSVMLQAINDALWLRGSAECKFARLWLLKPNPDFAMVCALADLEPGRVRAYARQEIAKADTCQDCQPRRGRTPKIIEHAGRAMTLGQWADHLGIEIRTLRGRLRNGWPLERALRPEYNPSRSEAA
jgi:hypothetical protein